MEKEKVYLIQRNLLFILWIFYLSISVYQHFKIEKAYQYPTITIYRDYITPQKNSNQLSEYEWIGSFNSGYGMNEIRISLKSNNVLDTVFHEYSHYIYKKKMTRHEKGEWYLLTDPETEVEYYSKQKMTEEKFANTFSYYLRYKLWKRLPSGDYTKSLIYVNQTKINKSLIFLDSIYEKYISE